jgi:hypothetical protein
MLRVARLFLVQPRFDRTFAVLVLSSAPPTDYPTPAYMQHSFPLWVDTARFAKPILM